MKLIFSKKENNEIDIKLQKGVVIENFTYIEMIRQLLSDNNFNDTDFGNLSIEEKEKVRAMLEKISEVFNEDDELETE